MNIIRARSQVLAAERSERSYISEYKEGVSRVLIRLWTTEGFTLDVILKNPYMVRTALGESVPIQETFWGDLR